MNRLARFSFFHVIPLLVFLFGAAAFLNGQNQVNREFPASPGQRLSIKLKTGGSVRVTGWDRPLISVSYEENGRGLDIEFIETGQGLEIRSQRGHGTRILVDLST